MAESRTYRTEGIVLKRFDFGEADRILTLYTPTHGKRRVLAKGVRRTKSRMAGHVELFTRSHLMLARGRQLDILTQAETIESYGELRTDLSRSTHAHYAAELLDNFSAEDLANYPLFALAVTTFRRLTGMQELNMVTRAFELQLLALTGYRPQLFRCLHCNEPIVPEWNRFSSRLGGILCPQCVTVDGTAVPISDGALKVLRNLQANESVTLQVHDLDSKVQNEVEKRLQEYIIFRLESQPRSIGVINRLRAEGAVT